MPHKTTYKCKWGNSIFGVSDPSAGRQAGNMSLFPSFFTYEQNPSGHSTTTEIKKNPQSLQSFQNKKV